jgi:hypothetical protein
MTTQNKPEKGLIELWFQWRASKAEKEKIKTNKTIKKKLTDQKNRLLISIAQMEGYLKSLAQGNKLNPEMSGQLTSSRKKLEIINEDLKLIDEELMRSWRKQLGG